MLRKYLALRTKRLRIRRRALLSLAVAVAAQSRVQGDITWDGTTNAFVSNHWSGSTPYVGATMDLNSGYATFDPSTTGQFLTFSNVNSDGEFLNVGGSGTFSVSQQGPPGVGYGVLINNQGQLNMDGSGRVIVAGPLSVGQDPGAIGYANFDGGAAYIGYTLLGGPNIAVSNGTDTTLYVGNGGIGRVTEDSVFSAASVTTGFLNIGASSTANGEYALQSGSLSAGTEYVGNSGEGSFGQTGGTNTVSGDLNIAAASGSTGLYSLSGGSTTVSGTEVVGDLGSGSFVQTGGINAAGTLSITGTGSYQLTAGTLNVGSLSIANPSLFSWSGGTLNLTNGSLTVGSSGALGSSLTLNSGQTLTLSSSLGSLFLDGGSVSEAGNISVTDYEDIGNSAVGTYLQTGGANSAFYLFLGYNSGASGTYNLSGGTLSIGSYEHVADSGMAVFTQSGGTHSVGGELDLAVNPGSSGTYNLSGGAATVSGNVYVGGSGSGAGGTGSLIVTGNASLTISGSLTAYNTSGSGINLTGGTISTGSLSLASPSLFNWSNGALNLTNSSWTVGAGGMIGTNLNLISGMTLAITGSGQSLNVTGAMNLSGGVITTQALSVSGVLNFTNGILQTTSISSTGNGQFNWTGGTLNVSSGVTIGAGGITNAVGAAFRTQQIGLTDAAHTEIGGYSDNTPIALNPAGQAVGQANRFAVVNGYETFEGQDAWLYSTSTSTTQIIGLTDAAHTGTGGFSYNTPTALNAAGQVAGWTDRLSGSTTEGYDAWLYSSTTNTTQIIGLTDAAHVPIGVYSFNLPTDLNVAGEVTGYASRFSGSTAEGQDAWLYSSSTNTTQIIGLTDAAHTETGGYSSNFPVALNAAGQVTGGANRYSGSVSQGQDAWLYSSSTNSAKIIGLTDSAHTQTGGSLNNTPVALNATGQVTGYAQRYSGGTSEGEDAWLYSPSTNTTQVIGLTDAAHTQTGGYSYNIPVALNSAGQVTGYADRYGGSTGEGQDAWLYTPSTNFSQLIGLTDAAHTQTDGDSYNYPTAMNVAGLVAGYADRFSGSIVGGEDAWVYDPAKNVTYNLSFSQSPQRYADSDIRFLSDNGVAVGLCVVYNGNSETQDAFVWTEANGFIDLGTLASGGLTNSTWQALASAYSVNSGGTILGTASTANGGQGVFLLTIATGTGIGPGMHLNSGGNVNVASGSVLSLAGGTIVAPAVTVLSGGNFNWTSGTLNITGTGSAFGGRVTVPNGGLLKLDGTIGTLVAVNPGGIFDLDANTGVGILVRSVAGIALASGSAPYGQVNVLAATNHANRQLIVTAGLVMAGSTNAWQGLVDLANNDMNVQGGSLTNLTNQIRQGFNNGNWNGGSGIVSTWAASDTTHLSALGVIQNNQSGSALFTTTNLFDGTTPGLGDVLIKYTYYGDTNLDGKVDGSDYSRIDSAFIADKTNPTAVTGWFNGDFNYDGVINGSDYTLIDNAFNTQGAALTTEVATRTAEIAAASTTAVPEPGMLSLLAIGSLATRRRRRR